MRRRSVRNEEEGIGGGKRKILNGGRKAGRTNEGKMKIRMKMKKRRKE